MSGEKTRPVHEVRFQERICAAIWENETQNGTRHNVTVSRLYKDGENWKDWSRASAAMISPWLPKWSTQAHSWIFGQPVAGAD